MSHCNNKQEPHRLTVYLSGAFLPRAEATISAFDRGFLYGDGFFETTRIHLGSPMHLERHLRRLGASCKAAGWLHLPDLEEMREAVSKLIAENCVETGYLRISVSRGMHEGGPPGASGPRPTVLIEARPMPELSPLASTPPFRLIRSPYRRNEHSPIIGHKSLSYQDNLAALAQARNFGADETYFLNTSGFLSECSFTNLFWVRAGEVFTPAVECGILPGITREIVLEIIADGKIPTHIGRYEEADLLQADEVFCTNSLRGVIPVCSVAAGKRRRKWNGWPLVQTLAEKYSVF